MGATAAATGGEKMTMARRTGSATSRRRAASGSQAWGAAAAGTGTGVGLKGSRKVDLMPMIGVSGPAI
jgi:hypothetical protein